MTNLFRRGGVWWVRLVVPARLRDAAGRREFTRSTKTHELHIAKLVAAVMLADWRKQLMMLESTAMSGAVWKLLEPAPALAIGGTISLDQAALLGVERVDALRIAAAGSIVLHCRVGVERGRLVAITELEHDPETGESQIPSLLDMPTSVVTLQSGVLALPDSREIANAVLARNLEACEIVALQAPDDPLRYFVPDSPIAVDVGRLEMPARAVRKIREHLLAKLSPEQIERAFQPQSENGAAVHHSAGSRSTARFSQALEVYCTDASGLPANIASVTEQRQRRAGLMLFAEFMGDLQLQDIDAHKLRSFRDGPLRQLPASSNHLPKELRKKTMKETIKVIADSGLEWPVMTDDMQQERMRWLGRFFDWLRQKEWITSNPALPLKGETGLTKAAQKERRRGPAVEDDESVRQRFTKEELELIFGQRWFATGTAAGVKESRFWYPFEYWLPALGLFAGCRIKEASQLHLVDVRQVDGNWVLDINETTPDKSLKNMQSRRQVPLHPRLIDMGFVAYCERLKAEGFRRVFPELTWATTDAKYAKEPVRKMSFMLRQLGMPRNGLKVFHCFRHNMNNALARVPASTLSRADDNLRKFIRYTIMGHQVGEDVNARHYMSTSIAERSAMVAAVEYELPPLAPLDIDFAVKQVRIALGNKTGFRRGCEDMGPLNGHAI